MRYPARTLAGLFMSTALGSVLLAQSAAAQEAAAAAANAAQSNDAQVLGDVVVTATRQADTVNRVPLSISAVTQKALDQQGIKNVSDLQRTVPALTVSAVTAGVATFTIRGIAGTGGATTATTGVYLDDIPLQKRSTNGVQQNNGTPAPPLFDLDRVEVLRGPQGTLFGGSSEGGTIRFITPQPSLTRYSAAVRAEVSGTHYGSGGYEGGLEVGGPIIQDKLGFRATIDNRHNGGYIDLVDPYNPTKVVYKDANSSDSISYRLAVAWAPSENSRATFSYYRSHQAVADATSGSLRSVNHGFSTPSYCNAVPAANSVSTSVVLAAVPCPANAIPGQTVNGIYMRPSQTYPGPYNFQPFQNFASNVTKTPLRSEFSAPSLTLDSNFEHMAVKSITSYIEDEEKSLSYETPQVTGSQGFSDQQGNLYQPGSTVAFVNGKTNVTTGANLFAPFPYWEGQVSSKNRRFGLIQELRFSSTGDPKPLSWVAGIYYSNIRGSVYYWNAQQTDQQAKLLFNVLSSQRYTERVPLATGQTCANLNLAPGVPSLTSGGNCFVGLFALPGALVSNRYQTQKDVEVAAFGEINWWLTDRFKATAGVRLSRTSFNYNQIVFGQLSGWTTPTAANAGLTNGAVTESPITPKFGLQYQITDNDMLYATAAKGYRAGGVNVPLAVAICGPGLALIGLTVDDAPKTYGSDSVWSYEGGGKFRLFGNKLQLNTSAYRIDWQNVQLGVSIPSCGPTFIQNAGTIRSQGFDLQAQGRIYGGLTGNLAVGYDNAQYTQTATGPQPKNGSPATPVVQKGDKVPVPPWTVAFGLQYDFAMGKYAAFVRGDYQYTAKYFGSFGPGVNGYSPDTRNLPSATQVNLRAGINIDKFDFNLFVNNLLDSTDTLGLSGGRGGCTPNTDASCATFTSYNPFISATTFRPRTIGAQLNYRY